MSLKNDLVNIGEMYSQAINEANVKIPKGTFKVATDKKPKAAEASDKAFVQRDSGPRGKDGKSGMEEDIIDPAKMTDAQKKKNPHEPAKFSQKNESSRINNYMSKKFDDLFKDVMTDKLHLRESDMDTVEDVASLPELDDTGAGNEDNFDMGGEDEGAGDSELEDLSIAEIIEHIKDALDHLASKCEAEAGEDLSGEEETGEDYGSEESDEEGAGAGADTAMETTGYEEVKGGSGSAKGIVSAGGKGKTQWNVANPVDGSGKLHPDSKGLDLAKHNNIAVKTSWKPATGKAQWNVHNVVDGSGKLSNLSDAQDMANPKKNVSDIKGSTLKAGRQIGS